MEENRTLHIAVSISHMGTFVLTAFLVWITIWPLPWAQKGIRMPTMAIILTLGLVLAGVLQWRAAAIARARVAKSEESPIPKVTLTLLDAYPEASQGRNWNLKERIALRNDSTQCIDVRKPRWLTEGHRNIPAKAPFGSSFEIERTTDKQLGRWVEIEEVHVPPTQTFHVWIGLDESFTVDDLRQRHEGLQLGTLALPVSIEGQNIEYKIKL